MTGIARETKTEVMFAAVDLFYTKGFHGTSIREISAKANVNVATVSYYFSGKEGLLEECLMAFFEPYIHLLERAVKREGDRHLLYAALESLDYYQRHHRFARFAWREVTFDSQMVREFMTCYLKKEKYLWSVLLAKDIENGMSLRISPSFFMMQLTSLLSMPFLQSQTLQEVWHVNSSESMFTRTYGTIMKEWLDSVTCDSSRVM